MEKTSTLLTMLHKSEHLLETICITNGCDEIQHISTQNNQTALVYFKATSIWSESVARPVNQMKCQKFSVLKNTCSNSEKLSRDDLFSSTQLYELMFQDIPVTSNKIEGKDGADIEHPPMTYYPVVLQWRLELILEV